jgi:heme-degrading monooxygenase HmoA
MYARVAEFENPRFGDASLVDELKTRARESAPRWQEAMPAARGHMMLVDRERGRALGVTFFDTEADIREAEPVFDRMGDEMPEETRGKRVGVSTYEVTISEGGEDARAARVSRFEGDAGRIDEDTRHAVDTILPRVRQVSGSKGIYSLADRSSGRVLTITLWDSPESLQASEEQADKLRAESAEAGGAKIAAVDRYEVAMIAAPTGAGAMR